MKSFVNDGGVKHVDMVGLGNDVGRGGKDFKIVAPQMNNRLILRKEKRTSEEASCTKCFLKDQSLVRKTSPIGQLDAPSA